MMARRRVSVAPIQKVNSHMKRPTAPSRRRFLLTASAAAATSSLLTNKLFAMTVDDHEALLNLSAREAVRRMSSGDLSSERYSSVLLAQCEKNKSLNAFISMDKEKVLDTARSADALRASGAKLGPLHGLPIPIKDSINTRDYPTTGGTAALRHFAPKEDAPIVQTLRKAGAIVLGKTNLHEMSYGWTSNNQTFGAVHNPYDPHRIPGGSSGGTAAAVAARMAPLGVAEDTQGSIRVPAALCGVAGFRPSTYRYSTVGAIPISPLFDQVGPHARNVADLILFDSVAAGDDSPVTARRLKGVKLGVGRGYWYAGLDPEVEKITTEALRKLKDAGVEFVEADVPGLSELIDLTTYQVQSHDTLRSVRKYLSDYETGVSFDELVRQLSPDVKRDFAHDVLPGSPGFVSDAEYKTIVETHLPKLKNAFREYFARTDVSAIVFPATMVPATPIGQDQEVLIAGKKVRFDVAVARNISPGSTAALPGLVLPADRTAAGLPVSLEFDGPAGSDRSLLALGVGLEHALGVLPPPSL
jgi:mandelamide amidase